MEFVMMKEFDREWNKLKLSDDDLQHLQNIIIDKPDAGDVIQGTGGLRKLRIAFPNKGKSGSGRVCYVTFITYDTTYLITVYAKNEKENISKADANAIADIIVKLENNLKGGKNMNVKESIMRGLNEALEYSKGNHSVGRSVTVNKKKEESIKLHIKESYTPDEWDIQRIAELVKFYLYDRGFESDYKLYRKDFSIRMWYKYENESYDRTVYLDDINWDWSEEEFEYWAKNKAEELAKDYFEYID